MSIHDFRAATHRRAPIAMPPLTGTNADAWCKTDHGALVDTLGNASHLGAQITAVRVLRNDGTDATLPTARPPQPLALLAPGHHNHHHRPHPTAAALPADPPAEMWHSPHRRSTPAYASKALASVPTVTAPTLPRRRRADFRNAPAEHEPQPYRIPTWLLGLGALVFVATMVISSVAPWGWALPLWK